MNLKLVSALSIVGLLVACGDSGSSSTGGSGGTGGESTTTTGGGGEGGGVGPGPVGPGPTNGGGGAGGGEPACFDEGSAAGLVPLTAMAGQNLCTPALVTESFTACLDQAATEATCTAFTDANPECAQCVGFGAAAPTIHPALLPAGMYVFVNTIACEAVAQNKAACAQEAADLQFCVFNTCGECEQMTELPECLGFSEQGICGENFMVSEDCGTLFPAEGMESPECVGAGDGFEPLYIAVANYLCGAP